MRRFLSVAVQGTTLNKPEVFFAIYSIYILMETVHQISNRPIFRLPDMFMYIVLCNFTPSDMLQLYVKHMTRKHSIMIILVRFNNG